MTEVCIVQPYIPSYRVPFFEKLREALASSGVSLSVLSGTPQGAQAARGDDARPDWNVRISTRQLGPAVLTWSGRKYRHADALIFPHMGTWMGLNWALAQRATRVRRRKIGVWGHIASFVGSENPLDRRVEDWQLAAADGVFCYTQRGHDFALLHGARPETTVTLNNTVDLSVLEREVAALSESDLEAFRVEHRVQGPSLAYIGSLDQSKRIDLLVKSLDNLWTLRPDISVLIGGRGEDEHLLDAAVGRGQAIRLGYVGPREKALIGRTASGLLNPGRVGLVAVEALALQLPVVTTDFAFHAPEFDYLEDKRTCLVTGQTAESFAAGALEVLTWAPRDFPEPPRLNDMATAFADGVMRMLGR